VKTEKRTYALPPDTIDRFEQAVDPGHRSRVISELIREWLAQREREAVRQEIIKGCEDMAAVYQDIEHEWHPVDEELHRAVEY